MKKANKTMNFLDVEIKFNDVGLNTHVWQKHTNTGLLLNFYAIYLITWKSSLIKCFLHRAKCICSILKLYKQEVQKLYVIF